MIDPQNDQVFWNMAIVHMEMRKYDRARDDLQKAIAVNPSIAGYQEKLGTVLIELKDWQAAKAPLEKAIELEPALFKAYYKLAQVDEQLDDQQSALKHYTAGDREGPALPRGLQRARPPVCRPRISRPVGAGLDTRRSRSRSRAPKKKRRCTILLGTVYQQQKKFDRGGCASSKQRSAWCPACVTRCSRSAGPTICRATRKKPSATCRSSWMCAGAEAPAHYVKAARDKLSEMAEGF